MASPSGPSETRQLRIESLGAQGDGVASLDGRPVFIPFGLPGETVTAEIEGQRGRLVSVDEPSPHRRPARCSQYGVCGGCSLQHIEDGPYLAFKRKLVVDALAAEGLHAKVDPALPCPPNTRRRAVFAVTRTGEGVVIGFNARRSGAVASLRDCAIVTPGLFAALPRLRDLAAPMAPVRGHLDIVATDTAGGLDVAIPNAGPTLSADARLRAGEAAAAAGFARLSINGGVILEPRRPAVKAGPAWLFPPPGGFLQASAVAEANLVRLVTEAAAGARAIADLFAGSGTFSLPLAAIAPVYAAESSAEALTALAQAAHAPGLKPVRTERRDLFRRPLTRQELARFDLVVMDPPRAGAEVQSRELAASSVRRAVMVSCNPQTLARDLRLLVSGGFQLTRVTPVDQFLYSPHMETVAVLKR